MVGWVGDAMFRSYRIENFRRQIRKAVAGLTADSQIGGSLEVAQIHAIYESECRSLDLTFEPMGRSARISGPGKPFHIWGYATDLATSPLIGMTEDKPFVCEYLRGLGLPVPEGRSFDWRDERGALAYAATFPGEFVVKPAMDTSGGDGVSTHLRSRRDAQRAFRVAAMWSDEVLVEEHVAGEHFRVLVLRGKCISILHRVRPRVTGDGRTNIRTLIDRENGTRIHSSDWKLGDPPYMALGSGRSILSYLARSGLTLEDVPGVGEVIFLGGVANYSRGCTYVEVLDKADPRIVAACEQAAAALGMEIAGVDVMCADISRPEFVIGEINIGPSTQLHYFVENPEKRVPVAELILRAHFDLK